MERGFALLSYQDDGTNPRFWLVDKIAHFWSS